MKLIKKLGKAKFEVSMPEISSSQLMLDFNPVIKKFNLAGDYFLIHWQARPKGYREWGIYSSHEDSYRSVAKLKINLLCCESLQLDDKTAESIPSAVFHAPSKNLSCINDKAIIGQIFLDDV